MIFNGVTNYLGRICQDAYERYGKLQQEELERTGRSLLSAKVWFFDEMAYKLLSLVDGECGSFGEYLEKVRELVPVRKSYVLRMERDPEALVLLHEGEEEFLEVLTRVKETDTAEADCYTRVILGREREKLEYAILEKWDYSTGYWYPLAGEYDGSKLFLNAERLEPYWVSLCQMLGLPGERIYEYGESFYDDGQLAEVDMMFGYGGNEVAYLPKDLSWIIYFSHEGTVTFGGTIVPMVKELLSEEREHWDRWH